jgi:hypothetical protein
MATFETTPTTKRPGTDDLSLLANGSSGRWDVAVDETTSGPDRWFLQIEGPAASLYFEIPSVDVVSRMLTLLSPHPEDGAGPLSVGTDEGTPVTLVRDDEYSDRFFLIVGPADRPIARFVIAGTDAAEIAEALRQARADIDDAD